PGALRSAPGARTGGRYPLDGAVMTEFDDRGRETPQENRVITRIPWVGIVRSARAALSAYRIAMRAGLLAQLARTGVYFGLLPATPSGPTLAIVPPTSAAPMSYTVPAVRLVRDDGKPVSLPEEMNDGRPVVLNFIFTTCSSICPLMSQVFAQFQHRLSP